MKKTLVFVTLLFTVLAGGCATSTTNKKEVKVVFSESDPAVQLLNESSLRIAKASEQAALALSVNKMRSGLTEEYKIDLDRLPQELREPLLLETGFHGELEAFITSLADVVGYRKVVLGNKPSTPIIISMSEQRRAPALWFADAGYQSGNRADVTLNPSIKQVILKYREDMNHKGLAEGAYK